MKFQVLLFLFIQALSISAQQNKQVELHYLPQHWIQSEKDSREDTLVFHPEGNEKITDAPMYLLYGGWTFFPEGQVYKHRWKKCGNDPEPDFRSGSWKKKGNVIKIKIAKEQYLYEILELSKETLKVRNLSGK